jgi:hypothetical protein
VSLEGRCTRESLPPPLKSEIGDMTIWGGAEVESGTWEGDSPPTKQRFQTIAVMVMSDRVSGGGLHRRFLQPPTEAEIYITGCGGAEVAASMGGWRSSNRTPLG